MRVDLLLLAFGIVACLSAAPFLIILADLGVGTTVCTLLLGGIAGIAGVMLGVLLCSITSKPRKRN